MYLSKLSNQKLIEKLSKLSNQELIERLKKEPQDQKAWKEFIDRYRNNPIGRTIIHIFTKEGYRDFSQIDDLLNDVCFIYLKDDFRILKNFRNENENAILLHLYRTTKRATIAFLKKAKEQRKIEIPGINNISAPSPSNGEFRKDVEQCLEIIQSKNRNGDRNKLLFKLHFFEGLKVKDIPELLKLKLTHQSVYRIIDNMKEKVKNCLNGKS